jgi:poly(3-hydroxybutyrate) depolymerase
MRRLGSKPLRLAVLASVSLSCLLTGCSSTDTTTGGQGTAGTSATAPQTGGRASTPTGGTAALAGGRAAPGAAATGGSPAAVGGTGVPMSAATAGTSAVGSAGSGGGAPAGPVAGAGGGSAPTETCDIPAAPAGGAADPCKDPLKPGDDRLCKMMIGGAMRQFYIYASPKFNPCQPASVIMDCHGASESAEVHVGYMGFTLSGSGTWPSGYGSGWRHAIKNDNAILITPQGTSNMWSATGDIPFLNTAQDTVEAIAKVDKEKVYVTGISMGGMMTISLGCNDSKRWRGFSPVAMLSQTCSKLDRPVPVISFHSEGDQLTSYPDDREGMENIAMLNNCKSGPTMSASYGGPMSSPDPVCFATPYAIGEPDAPDPNNIPLVPCMASWPATTCETWSQCDEGVEVTFCTVAADMQPIGGHILYGNDTNLDLAEVAWPFFKKFWK